MAVVDFNVHFDYRKVVLMADYYDWFYDSTYSPSKLWMSDGFNEITAESTLSDFKETNDGWSGKATSLTFSDGDSVLFQISDIEYEIDNNVVDTGYQIASQTFFGDIAELANILSGDDVVTGSNYSDRLAGFNGDDLINGNDGNDWLEGWTGRDTLDGGAGTDTADYSDKTTAVKVTLNKSTNVTVYVNTLAEDTIKNIENITGGSGADAITGDSNANTLKGSAGNDTLDGGTGNDVLYGGSGADKFVFDATLNASINLDTIKDFALKSDKIVLDDDIFKAFAGKSGVSSSQLKVVNSVSDLSGNGYLTYVKANDTLYYDSNGSGTGDVAFVKIELSGTTAPTYSDFQVIA